MNSRRWLWILVFAGLLLAAPGPRAACSLPISVHVQPMGASFTASFSNPTNHAIAGYIGVSTSLSDGSTGLASLPFNLPSHGSGSSGATFPNLITGVNEVVVCDTPPWGISESPDPVIVVQPPPGGGGGGTN